MKTAVCMILDESGSMGGKKDALVEGFNALLDDQLKNKGETNFYLFKFNDNVTTVYNNIPLQTVPKMTQSLYQPDGNTALYDAISEGIKIGERNVANVDRVIVIIFTDGFENASRYSNEVQTKAFFDKFHRRGNWSFLYIGENSKEFAEKMGIPLRNTIDFRHGNVRANFEAASRACTTLRESERLQHDHLLADFCRTENEENKRVIEKLEKKCEETKRWLNANSTAPKAIQDQKLRELKRIMNEVIDLKLSGRA